MDGPIAKLKELLNDDPSSSSQMALVCQDIIRFWNQCDFPFPSAAIDPIVAIDSEWDDINNSELYDEQQMKFEMERFLRFQTPLFQEGRARIILFLETLPDERTQSPPFG